MNGCVTLTDIASGRAAAELSRHRTRCSIPSGPGSEYLTQYDRGRTKLNIKGANDPWLVIQALSLN
jgi:hypothetical protein